jgi:hypothetical protein
MPKKKKKKLSARQQMLKPHMRTSTDTYVQMYNEEKKLFAWS